MSELAGNDQADRERFTPVDLSNHERVAPPAGIIEYKLPDELWSEVGALDLPYGYGLSGGAARDLALGALTGQRLPPRDIDVVAFADFDPDTSPDLLRATSERLMPIDFAYGDGVRVERLETYFSSRDFTINEVAVVDGRIFMTPAAEGALREGIIEPTKREHDPAADWYLPPKLAVKAVLLESVLTNEGFNPHIEGFDPKDYLFRTSDDGEGDYRPFYVALGFQKALEHGSHVARDFLDRLVAHGMISNQDVADRGRDAGLADFADHLRVVTDDFDFRGKASDLLKTVRGRTIGEMLEAISPEVMDEYDHYHEISDRFGGKGRKYTDESTY